jgi:hypothetical protein
MDDVWMMKAGIGAEVAIGNSLGEGTRKVSWLWMAPGMAAGKENGMNDGKHCYFSNDLLCLLTNL